MLQTIKKVFHEIVLLAEPLESANEDAHDSRSQDKEPLLQISMALENPTNFPKGSFHLIKGIGRGSFTAVMAAR